MTSKMPRPAMPPTPASSTEIKGQDGSHQLSTLQMAFELPPSAMNPGDAGRSTNSDIKAAPISPIPEHNPESPSSSSRVAPYPTQPSETVKSRRRSSTAQKDSFALPPPPTRSRKIIQMKPRAQEEVVEQPPATKAASAAGSAKASTAGGGGGAKKKQPSATSAAGRKIARKTAHSLIERRRRSKMNEEFAVLKNLIPACTGEMHKLAILQASIEYVRYLEDCVAKLKSQHAGQSGVPTPTAQFMLPPSTVSEHYADDDDEDDGGHRYADDGSGDVEMGGAGGGSAATSPTYASTPSRSQQPSISPALLAQDARHRQHSYSSTVSATTADQQRHYSYSTSATTSPAFGPQVYGGGQHDGGVGSVSNSTLTSPALPPQRDFDQEATAALLMLNNDRRGMSSGGNGAGRGMSVRDLLSA